MRMSRELDVCGDLTATVDNPSELIAWATVLTDPTVLVGGPQDLAVALSKSVPTTTRRRCAGTSR